MQTNEIIYVTKEEYDNFKTSIDNLLINSGRIVEQINTIRQDNPRSKKIEELIYLREGIKERILEKRTLLKKMKVTEKDTELNYANIGDILLIKTYYPDDVVEETCELVTGESDIDVYPEKISITSPKGKAIYKTNFGESGYFTVGKVDIKVDVIEKLDVKKLTKNI